MSIIEKLGITPGPWAINGYTDEDTDFEVYADPKREYNGRVNQADWICDLCSDNTMGGVDRTINNAKIIAAAPEMLEALIKSTLVFESYAKIHSAKGTKDGSKKALRNKEIAVCQSKIIEQATGRTWEEIKRLYAEGE